MSRRPWRPPTASRQHAIGKPTACREAATKIKRPHLMRANKMLGKRKAEAMLRVSASTSRTSGSGTRRGMRRC